MAQTFADVISAKFVILSKIAKMYCMVLLYMFYLVLRAANLQAKLLLYE